MCHLCLSRKLGLLLNTALQMVNQTTGNECGDDFNRCCEQHANWRGKVCTAHAPSNGRVFGGTGATR